MTAQKTKSTPSPENTSPTENASPRRSQSSPVPSMGPATITTQEKLPETLGASAVWRFRSWRAGNTNPVHKGFFCQTGPLGGYPWNQTMSHAVEEGRKSWDESWAHFAWKEAFPVPHEESHSSQQCQGTPPTPPLLGAIQDVSEEKRTQQEMRRGWWHHTGDTMTSSHPQSAAGKIPSGVGSSSGTQCEHSSWPGHGDTGTHCSFKQQTA